MDYVKRCVCQNGSDNSYEGRYENFLRRTDWTGINEVSRKLFNKTIILINNCDR